MIQLPINTAHQSHLTRELKRFGMSATELLGALNGWRKHEAQDVFKYRREDAVKEAREACNVSESVREDAVLAMMGWNFDAIDKAHKRMQGDRKPWMKDSFIEFGLKGFAPSAEGLAFIAEMSTPVFVGDVNAEPVRSLLMVSEALNRLVEQGVMPGTFPHQYDKAFRGHQQAVFPSLLGTDTEPLSSIPKAKRKNMEKPGKIGAHASTK